MSCVAVWVSKLNQKAYFLEAYLSEGLVRCLGAAASLRGRLRGGGAPACGGDERGLGPSQRRGGLQPRQALVRRLDTKALPQRLPVGKN